MRPIKTGILAGGLTVLLLGAGPAESPDQKVARLQAEVESLRQTNASLQQHLAEAEAEKARLRADLARARSQPPRAIPPTPYMEPPGIPPNAVPRGEGNVWHYIVPVEQRPTQDAATTRPATRH